MTDNMDFMPVEEVIEHEKPVTKPAKQDKKPKGVDKQAFVARKLKAINLMTNEAKARGLAERVMRNH